jgi:hypothetical protein
MLLANLFLLVWDYRRLKNILPFSRPDGDHHVVMTSKFPFVFFTCPFAAGASVRARQRIRFALMGVEAPARQGARSAHTGSMLATSNAARRDASAARSVNLIF